MRQRQARKWLLIGGGAVVALVLLAFLTSFLIGFFNGPAPARRTAGKQAGETKSGGSGSGPASRPTSSATAGAPSALLLSERPGKPAGYRSGERIVIRDQGAGGMRYSMNVVGHIEGPLPKDGTLDIYVMSNDQSFSSPKTPELQVKYFGGTGAESLALIKFDLPQFLEDKQLTSASLKLHFKSKNGPINVYRMGKEWFETMDYAAVSRLFSRQALAFRIDPDRVAGSWAAIPVTLDARAWLKQPASNHGLLFAPDGENDSSFDSIDSTAPAFLPRLSYDFRSHSSGRVDDAGDVTTLVTRGWPAGSYKVEINVDGRTARQAAFTLR